MIEVHTLPKGCDTQPLCKGIAVASEGVAGASGAGEGLGA